MMWIQVAREAVEFIAALSAFAWVIAVALKALEAAL